MKDSERIVGLAFAGLTIFHLIRGDWLGFAIAGMASASMLLGGRLKLPPAVEAALGVLALALIAVRLVQAFA